MRNNEPSQSCYLNSGIIPLRVGVAACSVEKNKAPGAEAVYNADDQYESPCLTKTIYMHDAYNK